MLMPAQSLYIHWNLQKQLIASLYFHLAGLKQKITLYN